MTTTPAERTQLLEVAELMCKTYNIFLSLEFDGDDLLIGQAPGRPGIRITKDWSEPNVNGHAHVEWHAWIPDVTRPGGFKVDKYLDAVMAVARPIRQLVEDVAFYNIEAYRDGTPPVFLEPAPTYDVVSSLDALKFQSLQEMADTLSVTRATLYDVKRTLVQSGAFVGSYLISTVQDLITRATEDLDGFHDLVRELDE